MGFIYLIIRRLDSNPSFEGVICWANSVSDAEKALVLAQEDVEEFGITDARHIIVPCEHWESWAAQD